MKKNFLMTGMLLLFLAMGVQAQQKINLAGVYEANTKLDVGTKQLYAVLDFNACDVPDFTKLFPEKTAKFALLPDDFMKKTTKNFQGRRAAGFVKYRQKFLINLTEQLCLTNPRMEKGVITVDWEDELSRKGTCTITVNTDKSIVFNGLGAFEDTSRPDGLVITCVEDRSVKAEPKPSIAETDVPDTSLPERVVEVTKANVNVRKLPDANAQVLEKATLGKQYEFLEEAGAWYKVKMPAGGAIAYVSKSVATVGNTPYLSGVINENTRDYLYEYRFDRIKSEGYEKVFTYRFWTQPGEKNRIYAWHSSLYANTKGQMRTEDTYYKGRVENWYIILEEMVDFDGNFIEKIEPKYVYKSAGLSGYYAEGVYFKEEGNPFE